MKVRNSGDKVNHLYRYPKREDWIEFYESIKKGTPKQKFVEREKIRLFIEPDSKVEKFKDWLSMPLWWYPGDELNYRNNVISSVL